MGNATAHGAARAATCSLESHSRNDNIARNILAYADTKQTRSHGNDLAITKYLTYYETMF